MNIAESVTGSMLGLIGLAIASFAPSDPVAAPPTVATAPELVAAAPRSAAPSLSDVVVGLDGRRFAVLRLWGDGPMSYMQGCNNHQLLFDIDPVDARKPGDFDSQPRKLASAISGWQLPDMPVDGGDWIYIGELGPDLEVLRVSTAMSLDVARRSLAYVASHGIVLAQEIKPCP